MENLDLKQMSTLVDIIAEEKGLERETVLGVVEQAIAAAWRKEAGERDMNVRATLNTQTGEADVYIARTVVEDGVGYNPASEIPLAEAVAAVESGVQKRIARASAAEAMAEATEGAKGSENEAKGGEAAENATDEEKGAAAEDGAEAGNEAAGSEEAATEEGGEAVEGETAGEGEGAGGGEKSGEKTEVTEGETELEDDGAIQIGDVVEEKIQVTTFGRVAAMTAKQVVIQRLREAENDAVLAAFEDKVGTVVTGTVTRIEPKLVRIDLGRASGIMPRSEQIDGEYYSVGHRIKVYIKNIERGDRGTQLILSRGNPAFIEYLFRQEVPELANGTVEVRGIAREAGRRTKIAVVSTVPGIDPVGTFVGGRGIRVQAVMNEIGEREKIDIINWSDNASEYIREALSPAEIAKVEIDGKKAKVFVTEDQQKIAIGTKGQNVRLASKLTGFDLDIELLKVAGKKKKQNIEDSLLSAVEDSEEGTEEGGAVAEEEKAVEEKKDALAEKEEAEVETELATEGETRAVEEEGAETVEGAEGEKSAEPAVEKEAEAQPAETAEASEEEHEVGE